MTKLVTNSFKVNTAEQFRESITEANGTNYYVFAGRHLSWDDDASPPVVSETQHGEVYDVYNNMIFGKKITGNDVYHAVRRIDWTSGTVYTQYDDKVDITNEDYYVVVDDIDGQRSYFKCLDNNNGAQSTQRPSVADLGGKVGASNYSNIYQTVLDGYVWKYMGGVSDAIFEKFSTNDYMPVIPNANVISNASDGAIEAIKVVNGGTEYNSYHSGYFRVIAYQGDQTKYILSADADANNDFYTTSDIYIPATGEIRTIVDYQVVAANTNAPTTSVRYSGYKIITLESAFLTLPNLTQQYEILPQVSITGDGSNAIARAIVNTAANTVHQVVVVNRGSGYSYATVAVTGNTGSATAETANVAAIISPPGGHGSDIYDELDASQLIFSVNFANSENSTISINNDYRTVGILRDPLFANVQVTFTGGAQGTDFGVPASNKGYIKGNTSGATAIVTDNTNSSYLVLGDVLGTFEGGETITEYTSNAYSSTTGITGVVNTARSHGQTQSGYTSGTFRQTTRVTFANNYISPAGDGIFAEDDFVKQDREGVLTSNGYVQEAIGTHSTMVQVDLTNVQGLWQEDYNIELMDASGDRAPIARIDGVLEPDLKKNSGEVLYIENIQPVDRAADQTETINLVIKF